MILQPKIAEELDINNFEHFTGYANLELTDKTLTAMKAFLEGLGLKVIYKEFPVNQMQLAA